MKHLESFKIERQKHVRDPHFSFVIFAFQKGAYSFSLALFTLTETIGIV